MLEFGCDTIEYLGKTFVRCVLFYRKKYMLLFRILTYKCFVKDCVAAIGVMYF